MNVFWMMDQWLIAQFERFAHWFQRLTGKTNFFLASMLNMVNSVAFLLIGFTSSPIYFMASTAFLSYSMFDLWHEKIALHRVSRGSANPFKAISLMKFMRVVGYPTFFASLIFYSHGKFILTDQINIGVAFLVWLVAYLNSCDPLPPSQSKIRKWLNSLRRAFSPQVAPAGSRA